MPSTASAGAPLANLPELVPGLPGLEQVDARARSVTAAIGAEPAMVAEVNRVRAGRGLRAFRYADSLRRSAASYARWMLRTGYFGHLSSIRASQRYRRLAEALALGSGGGGSIRGVVRHWLRSPPHRRLVLSRAFRQLGAGRARGRFHGRRSTTWVLHLGA